MLWIIAWQMIERLVGTPTPLPTLLSGGSASSSGPASQSDSTITAAVIGALIAAGALLASTMLTQWLQYRAARQTYREQKERDDAAFRRQIERERAADQRAIREEQRQRFYPAAMVVFNAALEFQSVAHQSGVLLSGETEESRNQRLNASLKEALIRVNEAMLTLTFDTVGSRLDKAFRAAQGAYNAYMLSLPLASPVGSASPNQQALDTLDTQVEEITTLIKNRLQQLETTEESA